MVSSSSRGWDQCVRVVYCGTFTMDFQSTCLAWWHLFPVDSISRDDANSRSQCARISTTPLVVLPSLSAPGFDLLRLFLAAPEFLTGLTISDRQVDIRLYMLHAVFYGLINATVFYWISMLAKSQVVAVIATIAWALYPAISQWRRTSTPCTHQRSYLQWRHTITSNT